MRRHLGALTLILATPTASLAAAPPTGDPGDGDAVIARLAVRSLLLGVTVVPGNGLVAVGERGHVLASSDGGVTWQQRPAPTHANLTAVRFADSIHGWAVGHDEVILRTTDGGLSWTRTHYAPERQQPLLDVWFGDASHGLAVGAFATLYRSADGGVTWVAVPFAPQPLPAPEAAVRRATPKHAPRDALQDDEGIAQPHLNAIARGATGRLYLAAEAGHLYRSDDDGGSWYQLPSPYDGSFFGVLPLDGDALLAFGLRGHLYRSDDAGRSWRALDSHTQALLAGGTRLPDGTVVLAGLAGVVLVSGDGGETFHVHQQADRKGFDGVAPAAGGVVLVGDTGVRVLPLAALRGGD
jgi:photosystem II stability/assembly factor-like uncharacterized protein